jgi:signal transduction histidine kinase
VFRAVRELLMNVLLHARTTQAAVTLHRDGGALEVRVEDAGVGFDSADGRSPWALGGSGLLRVREQIARLGGTVDVVSTPGMGTHVTMRVRSGETLDKEEAK